ncbi:MAG: NPCBM/NEW2 domain-containing protein [Phycisphaeraceae bacterium]|nr:NPCBM/NEW2 domain-containing protein [Phycisphaeraceae bacterium]
MKCDHLLRSTLALGVVVPALLITLLAGLSPLQASASEGDAWRITLLDGTTVEGSIRTWGESAVRLAGEDSDRDPLTIRRAVRTDASPSTRSVEHWVHFASGGKLGASNVTVAEGLLNAQTRYGRMSFNLESIKAVSLSEAPDGLSTELFDASLRAGDVREDRLFAVQPATDDRPARVLPVTGVLEGIGDENVGFNFRGESRSIGRERVIGVRLATPDALPTNVWTAHLVDGSSIPAVRVTRDGNRAVLELGPGEDQVARVPWTAVWRIDVRSDRMVFLSDLNPVEVVEDPLLDIARPWQRDRNVHGGDLVIGERTFEKGLGVRSYCRLTFEIGGRYETFAVTMGIDALTRGAGDCEFVVLADGREVLRQRVRGIDPPRPVTVPIAGVQRLTLVVEYGEDLSLSDIANWADARLLKPMPE